MMIQSCRIHSTTPVVIYGSTMPSHVMQGELLNIAEQLVMVNISWRINTQEDGKRGLKSW